MYIVTIDIVYTLCYAYYINIEDKSMEQSSWTQIRISKTVKAKIAKLAKMHNRSRVNVLEVIIRNELDAQ